MATTLLVDTDILIDATAIESELALATRNIRDFRFIDGLKLAEYPNADLQHADD